MMRVKLRLRLILEDIFKKNIYIFESIGVDVRTLCTYCIMKKHTHKSYRLIYSFEVGWQETSPMYIMYVRVFTYNNNNNNNNSNILRADSRKYILN